MPEGPEVRRYALQLQDALENQEIVALTARHKAAKAWLLQDSQRVLGRKILRIRSHGKHLFGIFEGEIGFHSHLMMWGRWWIYGGEENPEIDRRERARIVVPKAVAILTSAPVFEIFEGDPYQEIDHLRTLGPDILPYDGVFDAAEFVRRLSASENLKREIGAVLLDQRVAAGIGNYLRADALFLSQINPYRRVEELSPAETSRLCEQIPLMAKRALNEAGVSIPSEMRARLLRDETLSYQGRIVEWAARHAVFRRTNLPCLVCGTPIKQKQQVVLPARDGDAENEAENEKSRTIYFCPICQNVDLETLVTPKKSRKKSTVSRAPEPKE
ncbi:endonuclease-8/formamidopyrimidine-DNA glycosylase [Abditibacterium utsteinense]|uniref:DNA-(apurinic or apyrimidinic site) lyase n=1 Tax=Abditibacterium utsteinense TaxID=1960156 RepID=A0A2S8SWB1_9BACT|nr:DNA-formamidopyrimidine glycosylase family protein [Abditibacterium utsteinense]PQV65086.1 endonuclease-8/formamidopyrimidine-DNA glycosylase [Abditibacterium utsteinense]